MQIGGLPIHSRMLRSDPAGRAWGWCLDQDQLWTGSMMPREKALEGLQQIKAAIIELLQMHSDGLSNAEITNSLELQSDQEGKQRNYLAWSVLGILMKEGIVQRVEQKYRLKG
jgi:hypothetical protein